MEREVGWRIATFAADVLQPVAGGEITHSALWAAYLAWCERNKLAPLSRAAFTHEFDSVAFQAGIERRQVGAHVLYGDVALIQVAA